MPESRQLAAIMFTDIVGYTSLMGEDEISAYQLLKKNRQVQKPLIEKHGGKWLKEMGDGVLASFNTITDAVYCAIEIQKACLKESDLKLRIGIHQGEVIVEDGDVFGDGVNIASRLEPLAPVGGIYVSESVYRNIQNKEGIKAEFIREENLKNVKHPVRIYEVDVEGSEIAISETEIHIPSPETKTKTPVWRKPVFIILIFAGLIVISYLVYQNISKNEDKTEGVAPEKDEKSIAVLPFVNMSNDPDQEYFSDGIREEILNHLYKIEGLRIPSSSTSMKYKGTKLSSAEIAGEMGVNYILEGSVRKAENTVRISVKLIDVPKDKRLMSEQYDRELIDILSIQSEVAQKIAVYLQAEISPEVKKRIESKMTVNTYALDLYFRAKSISISNFDEAEKLLYEAIAIDSNFAPAFAELGFLWAWRGTYLGDMNAKETMDNVMPFLEKALELNYDYPATHTYLGAFKMLFEWDFETGMNEINIAKQLNPADIEAVPINFLLMLGEFENAYARANIAYSIDPNSNNVNMGLSYYFLNQEGEALKFCKSAMETNFHDVFGTGRLCLYLELYDEVISISEEWLNNNKPLRIPVALGNLAISYYHIDQKEKVIPLLEELKEKSEQSPVGSPAYFTSMIYAQMGEKELAYEWLEKAYNNHEVEMIWLKVEPPFGPLHDDPRWQEMLDKVGFPD